MKSAVRVLFLDVGGVLLTDGWDHNARKRAAKEFNLALAEINIRHHLMFETYEEGKLTLDEYLDQLIFYEKRKFTRAHFRKFMFEQSRPYPKMIELFTHLKERHRFKVAVVSNEASEINAFRIKKFKLGRLVDFFVSSGFVSLRKPDADIFKLALNIAQVPAQEVLFVDNTPLFVRIAEGLGIRSILHESYKSTCAKLTTFGLEIKS